MLKRRSIKVSDRWGKSEANIETKMRDKMLNAEERFEDLYKSMSRSEKKKFNYEDGRLKAKKEVDRAKSMKFFDDTNMLLKNSQDKPLPVNKFVSLIKKNLHPNLCLVPNNMVGENVGGHSIMFLLNNELEFICGVGKNCAEVIYPETEFQNIDDGQKTERKIKSRGYLAAIQTIIGWLNKYNLTIRNKDFLN